MTRLLVATRNAGKLREYQTLFSGLSLEWVSLQNLGLDDLDVAETGSTFAENAHLKALAYASAGGLLTLADDSGLEVDALDGAPGVHTARYAGPGASDADRYRKLLAALESVPDGQRTARFRCVVAIAAPGGEVHTAEGVCEGAIARAPRGENGFGYDPVFIIAGRGRTMAELGESEKNAISHRGRALDAAHSILAQMLEM